MLQIRTERRSNGVALYKGSNGLTSLTFQVWLLCTRINIDGNTINGFCSWEISLLHILACFFFLLSFRSNSRTPYKPPHQWNLLTPNKLHWYRKRQKKFRRNPSILHSSTTFSNLTKVPPKLLQHRASYFAAPQVNFPETQAPAQPRPLTRRKKAKAPMSKAAALTTADQLALRQMRFSSKQLAEISLHTLLICADCKLKVSLTSWFSGKSVCLN